MGGKQPLKIEGYCNRNWLSEHFQPPGEGETPNSDH